jgi:hypothetical protein
MTLQDTWGLQHGRFEAEVAAQTNRLNNLNKRTMIKRQTVAQNERKDNETNIMIIQYGRVQGGGKVGAKR